MKKNISRWLRNPTKFVKSFIISLLIKNQTRLTETVTGDVLQERKTPIMGSFFVE